MLTSTRAQIHIFMVEDSARGAADWRSPLAAAVECMSGFRSDATRRGDSQWFFRDVTLFPSAGRHGFLRKLAGALHVNTCRPKIHAQWVRNSDSNFMDLRTDFRSVGRESCVRGSSVWSIEGDYIGSAMIDGIEACYGRHGRLPVGTGDARQTRLIQYRLVRSRCVWCPSSRA